MTEEEMAFYKELGELQSRVKEALQQLLAYARSHPLDETLAKSLPRLVLAGAVSLETGAFLAAHGVRFYGFKKKLPVTGVMVFKKVFPDRDVTLIGWRDGTVSAAEAPRNQNAE